MRPTADSALTLLLAQLLPPHRGGSAGAGGLLPLRGSASPCACRAGGSCCWPAARTWGHRGRGAICHARHRQLAAVHRQIA